MSANGVANENRGIFLGKNRKTVISFHQRGRRRARRPRRRLLISSFSSLYYHPPSRARHAQAGVLGIKARIGGHPH